MSINAGRKGKAELLNLRELRSGTKKFAEREALVEKKT